MMTFESFWDIGAFLRAKSGLYNLLFVRERVMDTESEYSGIVIHPARDEGEKEECQFVQGGK